MSELVGRGRSADVFEHGEGRVLRRYRTPRNTRLEVAAMEHARAHGFPAPAARAVSDTDIVMDRVTGPTMLADLTRRPWRIMRHADSLAALHHRLQRIAAPSWLETPLGEGDALLHLDLHPENVLLSPSGPVVIDWPNAARGPGAADVAHTWIVLACSLPPEGAYRQAVSAVGRDLFLRRFLRSFDRDQLAPHLDSAGAYRLANRTLPERELEAISRLLEELTPP